MSGAIPPRAPKNPYEYRVSQAYVWKLETVPVLSLKYGNTSPTSSFKD
jgi:hypothetical protein